MIVNLTDGFFVDIDSNNNFTLKKNVVGMNKEKTEEKEYEKTFGYYSNMASAVKRCAMEMVKEKNEKIPIELAEYTKQYCEAVKRLETCVCNCV